MEGWAVVFVWVDGMGMKDDKGIGGRVPLVWAVALVVAYEAP